MDSLPKHIMLGGWKWRIELKGGLSDKEGNLGDTDTDKRLIRIDASLSPAEQWQTLFHESLHVALFLGGQSEGMSEDREEGIVRCAENILWPWLRQWIGK